MICKYYLILGSDSADIDSPGCIDVSSMISNLDDVEVSYARVGLGGVVRKIGSSIDFVGEARDRLVSLYMEKQLHAHASFAVYRITNDWTYTKFFDCPLDFSTFGYDGHTASCGMLDSSAAAAVKARKAVRYEIPVADIREQRPLEYDGMHILNDASFQIIGREVPDSKVTDMEFSKDVWWWVPRLGMVGSNFVNNESLLVTDQAEEIQNGGSDCGWGFPADENVTSCFAECLKDCVVTVDFSDFFIKDSSRMGFVLCKISENKVVPLTCGYSNLLSLDNYTRMTSVKWTGKLKAGEKLQYAVFNHDRMSGEGNRSFWIHPKDGGLSWNERSASVDIDVISPAALLDRLLENVGRGGERIYGQIKGTLTTYDESAAKYVEEENARLAGTMLAAADSIRNIPDARVNTSFGDFCRFMESVFGYVYHIEMRPKGASVVIPNSIDFEGMTELHTNTSYVDSPDAVIHFSTASMVFVGVDYKSSLRDTSPNFVGFERYQTYTDKSYKVREDVYFHDILDDVYYYATNSIRTLPDTGDQRWAAELHEYVADGVPRSGFVAERTFGGIVSDYETDSGIYPGEFDASCVRYVRRKKSFVYESGGMIYSSFPTSADYNSAGKARADVLYVNGGLHYCILGTSLMRCSVSEGEGEMVPTVVFRHRSELFPTASSYRIGGAGGFEYHVSSDRIYSEVMIGYAKQDYDIGNNGMDEFNSTVTYSIDQTLSESKLSLISPYRADCYGIEELAEKRGKETTSTSGDGGIFAVSCTRGKNRFFLDRGTPVEGVRTDTMFNALLSPVYMVRANERYLASFAELLRFASSDGNSSAVVGGVRMDGNVTLSQPLFGCGDISFESANYIIPDEWNGVRIEIESSGRIYRGFLQSLDLAADESEILKYKVIESK